MACSSKAASVDMSKLNPKPLIQNDEPFCSARDNECPYIQYAHEKYLQIYYCSQIPGLVSKNFPCIPGLRKQRDDALAEAKRLEDTLDRLGAKIDKIHSRLYKTAPSENNTLRKALLKIIT
jgi:hypothetical protein